MPVLLGPCWVPSCVFFRGGALSIARHKVGGRQCTWVTAGNPLTHSNHTRTHARKNTVGRFHKEKSKRVGRGRKSRMHEKAVYLPIDPRSGKCRWS